jgi:hypothetical protein
VGSTSSNLQVCRYISAFGLRILTWHENTAVSNNAANAVLGHIAGSSVEQSEIKPVLSLTRARFLNVCIAVGRGTVCCFSKSNRSRLAVSY